MVDEHMMFFPITDHDVDGLHCKFNALASKKIPSTGCPFIQPPDVKKAKRIRKKTGSPEKKEINFSRRINVKGRGPWTTKVVISQVLVRKNSKKLVICRIRF